MKPGNAKRLLKALKKGKLYTEDEQSEVSVLNVSTIFIQIVATATNNFSLA